MKKARVFLIKGELESLRAAHKALLNMIGVFTQTIYPVGDEYRMMVGCSLNEQEIRRAIKDKSLKIELYMPSHKQLCPECCGIGALVFSCCGDDITCNDFENCPSCGEHCGDTNPYGDQGEECGICEGTGLVNKPEIINT